MVREALGKFAALFFAERRQRGVMHAMVVGGKIVVSLSMSDTVNDWSHLRMIISWSKEPGMIFLSKLTG